ncbi:helix-turn-helix domain-containing protein [Acinetobacter proteolyticus]|uniref:helix-turn-helix domain-containing protein n=1 Tax=Acinetobacter proteolyticus TaxID=1776741 RepID=UPI0031DF2ED4
MLSIKVEKEQFLQHVRTLGVVSVQWDKHGVITGISREAYCGIGYDNIELMWETWIAAKKNGIVLNEQDIDEAISEPGTAVKKILTHVENVIIQKAIIHTNGNQAQAADQIGISRTKIRYVLKRSKSNQTSGAAA